MDTKFNQNLPNDIIFKLDDIFNRIDNLDSSSIQKKELIKRAQLILEILNLEEYKIELIDHSTQKSSFEDTKFNFLHNDAQDSLMYSLFLTFRRSNFSIESDNHKILKIRTVQEILVSDLPYYQLKFPKGFFINFFSLIELGAKEFDFISKKFILYI